MSSGYGSRHIVPNRYQPRHTFPQEELAELAASIKESGVLQPIMVRRKGDGIYELIAGERRWRASKEAGLETIPVVIRNCSDQESLLLALVENLQREDLNPMETARAYSRMMNEFGLTQDAIAAKVGRDRSSVANFVRLIHLHPELQELVARRNPDNGSCESPSRPPIRGRTAQRSAKWWPLELFLSEKQKNSWSSPL